jgi:hypothetical protein
MEELNEYEVFAKRGRFVFHVVIGDLDSSTGVVVTIGDH